MPQPHRISVRIAGQEWRGHWEREGREILVSSAYGSGRRPVERRKPETVAAEIMTELVEAWRAGRRG
jgi:hypothetical protein